MRGLIALAACALAQDAAVFSFSSNFNSTSAKTFPISSYDDTCSLYGSEYPYVVFNYTFPTAGVRLINTYGAYYVQVVNSSSGYNISDLCAGGHVWPLKRSTSFDIGSNTYQFGQWFEADSYTFIVQSSSTSDSVVVGEIWTGKYNGQLTNTTATAHVWKPVYSNSYGACTTGSYDLRFDTQIVSVNATGYYNAYVALNQNRGVPSSYQTPDYPYLSVLKGNVDVTAAVCDASFVGGDYGGSSSLSVATMDLWLEVGQNYTFVISGDEPDAEQQYLGYYTVVVTPGGYRQFNAPVIAANGFSPPTVGSCNRYSNPTSTCSNKDDPQVPIPYAVAYFSVPRFSPFYIRTRADGSSENDLAYYVYSERNSGVLSPLTCGTARQTCFYGTDGLSSGQLLNSGDNEDFTLVITGWYTSASSRPTAQANSSFIVISGPVVGATYSSRAPTTVAPSTAAPTQSLAPTTKAPSANGSTFAPTTRRPTNVGETNAPTSPTAVSPTTSVNGAAQIFPVLALFAGALAL